MVFPAQFPSEPQTEPNAFSPASFDKDIHYIRKTKVHENNRLFCQTSYAKMSPEEYWNEPCSGRSVPVSLKYKQIILHHLPIFLLIDFVSLVTIPSEIIQRNITIPAYLFLVVQQRFHSIINNATILL